VERSSCSMISNCTKCSWGDSLRDSFASRKFFTSPTERLLLIKQCPQSFRSTHYNLRADLPKYLRTLNVQFKLEVIG
jgi:hypothetical protein